MVILALREQLVHQPRAVRVLDHQALLLERILEHLVLDGSDPTDAKLLAKHEALDDDELLLIHGDDEHAVLFPRLTALGHDLADGQVLDLDLLAERIDFDVTGNVLHGRSHDDLAEVHELLLRDELLLAKLDHAKGLGIAANEVLLVGTEVRDVAGRRIPRGYLVRPEWLTLLHRSSGKGVSDVAACRKGARMRPPPV
jgi:hypothetical protein